MNYIYLLRHIYEFKDSQKRKQYENKFLGIYSSRREVDKAIERYINLPGFKEYSKKCFVVEKWAINKDMNWKEGFIKSFEARDSAVVSNKYDYNTSGFDVSSWVQGRKLQENENATNYVNRILNEKFGIGNWSFEEGLGEEYINLMLLGETYINGKAGVDK